MSAGGLHAQYQQRNPSLWPEDVVWDSIPMRHRLEISPRAGAAGSQGDAKGGLSPTAGQGW